MRYRVCHCGENVHEKRTSCPACRSDVGAQPFVHELRAQAEISEASRAKRAGTNDSVAASFGQSEQNRDRKQKKKWAVRAGIAFAIIFGWHLVLVLGFKSTMREGEALAQSFGAAVPSGLLDQMISINPITNTVTFKYPVKEGDQRSLMIVGAGGAMISALVEPQFQKHARRHLDLYAMLIPYSVKIEPVAVR